MSLAEFNKVIGAVVACNRGILAADESSGTIPTPLDATGA
jgi:fructose-bisphosphate aldolase class 1